MTRNSPGPWSIRASTPVAPAWPHAEMDSPPMGSRDLAPGVPGANLGRHVVRCKFQTEIEPPGDSGLIDDGTIQHELQEFGKLVHIHRLRVYRDVGAFRLNPARMAERLVSRLSRGDGIEIDGSATSRLPKRRELSDRSSPTSGHTPAPLWSRDESSDETGLREAPASWDRSSSLGPDCPRPSR